MTQLKSDLNPFRCSATGYPGRQAPTVSVIVPTHNRPEMLAEALDSVHAQTFLDFEIIVVSNGEDALTQKKSRAVSHVYGARHFALDGGNVSSARNFGVMEARGEWLAFLDDDDLWMPSKLARQIEEARSTGADAIIADFEVHYANGSKSVGMTRPPACSIRTCARRRIGTAGRVSLKWPRSRTSRTCFPPTRSTRPISPTDTRSSPGASSGSI